MNEYIYLSLFAVVLLISSAIYFKSNLINYYKKYILGKKINKYFVDSKYYNYNNEQKKDNYNFLLSKIDLFIINYLNENYKSLEVKSRRLFLTTIDFLIIKNITPSDIISEKDKLKLPKNEEEFKSLLNDITVPTSGELTIIMFYLLR